MMRVRVKEGVELFPYLATTRITTIPVASQGAFMISSANSLREKELCAKKNIGPNVSHMHPASFDRLPTKFHAI